MMNTEIIKHINKIRSELNREYNANMCFAGFCDLACERLIKHLPNGAAIIHGECIPDWDTSERVSHFWIELDGLIIDPTSDQMDFDEFIIDKDSRHYKKYLRFD